MRKIFNNVIDRAHVYRHIKNLPLKKHIRKSIKKSYIDLVCKKKYLDKSMISYVVDSKIYYLDYDSLIYLFNEIFVDNVYHVELTNTKPFILDCGSNIGLSLLYFKTLYPDAEISAFEPDPAAFACLSRNVSQNKMSGVLLHNCAVAGETGSVDLYCDENRAGALKNSMSNQRMPGVVKRVAAHRLSDFVDREVDLLKMDIEGGEGVVLRDLVLSGKISQIKKMLIEYHHHIDQNCDLISDFLRILEENGFGYQIEAKCCRPIEGGKFQDVLIYAYMK